jgi:3-oxoacyl-[acyl-carrier-protein] synthase II
MKKRVVVTGLGCITPLGNDVPTMWQNVISGKSGAGRITRFDASDYRVKIACEVKDFDPVGLFGARDARRMDRFSQLALASASQALENANMIVNDSNRDRFGVIIGSGIGGLGTLFEQMLVFFDRGPNRVSPFTVPMMLPDSCPALVAIQFGLRGPNYAVVSACATGTNAIGEATEIIRRGAADAMLAGGSDAVIVHIAVAGLGVMHAMSTRNDDPEHASRPFDKNRDGFVLGEGSAVLVLEELEFAKSRGANILAEISGYGITNDAFHITAPAIDGEGAAKCMQLALDDAGLVVNDIGYINAHGTSTPLNDKSETAAIKTVFGEQAYSVPISSTKSMTGHLLGAAGAVEAVVSIKTLNESVLPPTINYEVPDPECDLDYIPNISRSANSDHVMSNSFGFGGHNGTLIFSKYKEAN